VVVWKGEHQEASNNVEDKSDRTYQGNDAHVDHNSIHSSSPEILQLGDFPTFLIPVLPLVSSFYCSQMHCRGSVGNLCVLGCLGERETESENENERERERESETFCE
jgi:hypothetical protein